MWMMREIWIRTAILSLSCTLSINENLKTPHEPHIRLLTCLSRARNIAMGKHIGGSRFEMLICLWCWGLTPGLHACKISPAPTTTEVSSHFLDMGTWTVQLLQFLLVFVVSSKLEPSVALSEQLYPSYTHLCPALYEKKEEMLVVGQGSVSGVKVRTFLFNMHPKHSTVVLGCSVRCHL